MDWEKIWRDHWQEIYKYVYTRVGNRHVAEEVTQEAFIKALKATSRNQEINSIVALLKTIARNLIIDHWRVSKRRQDVPLQQDIPFDQKGPADMYEEKEFANEIRDALTELPKEQQDVIRYRLFQELSVKETAALMEKAEGAVRVLQHRAIKAVKEAIQRKLRGKEGTGYEVR